jgi:AraC-like DNA-binding protein
MKDYFTFEQPGYPFTLEYVKRTGPFTMDSDHYHAYYEMYYLLSGERYYFIRDKSYHIRKGDLVFINKRELHKTSAVKESPEHERVVIYFDESFLNKAYGQNAGLLQSPFHQEDPVCRFQVKDQMKAERLVTNMLQELKDRPAGYEINMQHGIAELMLLAARHTLSNEAAFAPLSTPLHQKMSEIARFINNHYAEPVSLPMLAGQFHISPYYLSRMFKKAIGLTMSEYVNLIRIKAAEQLLLETDRTVTDVASAVGYDNFSHFGKMFKKVTKVSPRAYRKS